MLIGLTGTNSSGKGEIVKYLERRGFKAHSLSDILREEVMTMGLYPSRNLLIEHGNRLRREEGEGILAERVLPALSGKDVVDSIRHPSEIAVLKKVRGFFLIAVDAPVDLRFARSRKRGREGDGSTLEDFIEKEELEKRDGKHSQQIHRCMEMSDFLLWNDGTLKELGTKMEEVLAQCGRENTKK